MGLDKGIWPWSVCWLSPLSLTIILPCMGHLLGMTLLHPVPWLLPLACLREYRPNSYILWKTRVLLGYGQEGPCGQQEARDLAGWLSVYPSRGITGAKM